MKIDGKAIAENILSDLSQKIKNLHGAPTLAVIQIGDDPASTAYIRQKIKAAEKIGAKVILSNSITNIEMFNSDPAIHGIIVQRPLPDSIGEYHVKREKDVDGFEPNSPFAVPVALAVYEILKNIHADISKNIVIIGRGETAGKPIASYFEKQHCTTSTISSQTVNPEKIMQKADIIISCVGKKIIDKNYIKPGVILISVGIWRDIVGKLHGDYNEDDIKEIASFYTPTPGGVGPVNVACLMQNLVIAAHNSH